MPRGARLLLLGWAVLAPAGAGAAKLFVAANGSDLAGCGARIAPCRSIGAALARAVANDTVEVGPGRYGDLNGDGFFDDPGDELAEVDTGCDCMIDLALPVRLVSRDGAGATWLDAGGAPIHVIAISAAGAVLGKRRRGFSVTGSGDAAGVFSGRDGVRVEANVALANGAEGLGLFGDGGTTLGNLALLNLGQGIHAESSDALYRGNRLFRNGSDGLGLEVGGGNRVLDTLAVLNGGAGLRAASPVNLLRGNASLGNGSGFELLGGNLLERSVAAGNGEGVVLLGAGERVQRSASVGNRLAGVRLAADAGATLLGNSLFGNDPAGNCGVATQNPLLAPLLGGNFWGAPAGPGADPADAFCELVMAPIPDFEPLLAKEIRVRSKAAQLLAKLAGSPPASPPPAPPRLFVAANGGDAPGCGTAASPCRSIGAALAQAQPGDTIQVGPGRYGDLNLDGAFDDPGDEAAEIDTGCDCMIQLSARVTLVSRDGAGATLIDASGAPIAAVSVDAANATLGAAKRGFTVTGSSDDAGVRVNANDVRVEGNLCSGNQTGALAHGSAPLILGNQLIGNGNNGLELFGVGGLVRGNVAAGNGGIGMEISDDMVLEDNLALGNGGTGFDLDEPGAVARRNVAVGNGINGFGLSDDSVLEGNLVVGNARGVSLFGLGIELRGNAIVGNEGAGVFVADGAGGTIVGNSVFGNFAGIDLSLSPGLNCGVALDVATPPLLSGNFWGAASGPGADPADDVCALVALAEPVVTAPLAAKEIRVRAKAAQ